MKTRSNSRLLVVVALTGIAATLAIAGCATQPRPEAQQHEFFKWDDFNVGLLRRLFTSDELTEEYSRFGAVAFPYGEPSLGEKIRGLHKDIDEKIHRLDSIIHRLEVIPLSSAHHDQATGSEGAQAQLSMRVFVVHGHDEGARNALEAFLHEIGLEPVE